MTLQELEILVKQIQDQVELNTLAINSISNRFSQYATLSQLYSTNSTTSAHSTSITAMQLDIANLQTSIGLVNKITKLLDVNIQGLAKDDLLQFDGDRWTNIKPSKLGVSTGGSGVSSLEALTDVLITGKTDGQALVWSNTDNKWVNRTISSGGSGGSGIDLDAMWSALASNTSNQINPSHITGDLTLSGLTVNGNSIFNAGSTQMTVNTSKVAVNGDVTSTGEVTAYSI